MGSRNQLLILLFSFFSSSALASGEVIPGEYIVKFKKNMGKAHVASKVHGKSESQKSLGRANIFRLKEKSGETIDIEALRRDPDVEYIEPNYRIRISGDCPTGVTTNCYHQSSNRVYATEAWALASAYDVNNRPIVAVIDSGVDTLHDVFVETSSIWSNTGEIDGNDVDDDANGFVDDINGWNFYDDTNDPNDDHSHGTHVAGIALGATMDIIESTALSNSNIRIMPIKFLGSDGSGATSDAVEAMYYAVDNGAQVINNSWGGGSYSLALHDAYIYAFNAGVLVVTAAGNDGENNNNILMYPANYDVPNNIAVAAVNSSDSLASFSNYGSQTVHLGAPGSFVESTILGNTFGSMSGTSMAAPFVAGAAALAWREAPQLSAYQMKELILGSVTPISALTGKVVSAGRINVFNLMSDVLNETATPFSNPSYTPVYRTASGAYQTTGRAPDGGCGLIVPHNFKDKGGPGGGAPMSAWPFVFLLLPTFIWFGLRQSSARRLPVLSKN